MTEGRYVYCILEGDPEGGIKGAGLSGGEVHVVRHKEIAALVSPVPFKEIESNLENILCHQKVVDLSREMGTTLPVRFGIIFKNEEGVKELLSKSYEDYRKKLSRLRGRDEFGVKVILNATGLKMMRAEVEDESDEVRKMKKEASKAGEGATYLLKIRMEETIKNNLYKKIDNASRGIHERLSKLAVENSILKSEHEQIILNAAYLVDRAGSGDFRNQVERIKKQTEKENLMIHMSGPWAPYSFC